MTNVNYRALKSNIIKACKPTKQGDPIDFFVDYNKLKDLVEDINLVPLFISLDSKPLTPDVIPYMSEYFNETHMNWLNKNRNYTTITFIDAEVIDEKVAMLLDDLKASLIDYPDMDKVRMYSELITKYPCYFATIVSYENMSPNASRPSFEISCRANKVVIKDSKYQYNHKDF